MPQSIGTAYGGTGLGGGGLKAGYIPFGAGTSAFATSTNLFWDSANFRLGIGTTTPYAMLSVAGGVVGAYFTATTTTASTFTYASTTALSATSLCLTGDNCRTTWPSGGSGIGWASSTDPTSIYFTGSGNVGIGTTSPYAKLSINNYSSGASTVPLFVVASSTGSGATSTAFIIDSVGNVGIGTTSPEALLHVNGTALFGNNGTQNINTNYNILNNNLITTSTVAWRGGINNGLEVTLTGDSPGGFLASTNWLAINDNYNHTGEFYGGSYSIYNYGQGTTSYAFALDALIDNSNNGTITDARGVNAKVWTDTGGTMTYSTGVRSNVWNYASSTMTNVRLFRGVLNNDAYGGGTPVIDIAKGLDLSSGLIPAPLTPLMVFTWILPLMSARPAMLFIPLHFPILILPAASASGQVHQQPPWISGVTLI